jgi:hypothetical protein
MRWVGFSVRRATIPDLLILRVEIAARHPGCEERFDGGVQRR